MTWYFWVVLAYAVLFPYTLYGLCLNLKREFGTVTVADLLFCIFMALCLPAGFLIATATYLNVGKQTGEIMRKEIW